MICYRTLTRATTWLLLLSVLGIISVYFRVQPRISYPWQRTSRIPVKVPFNITVYTPPTTVPSNFSAGPTHLHLANSSEAHLNKSFNVPDRNSLSRALLSGNLLRVYKSDVPVKKMEFTQSKQLVFNASTDKKIQSSTVTLPPQKTCAVVGNSGILLNSKCGQEINSQDFVIRCNIPEIKGFVGDVGWKTNLTTINQQMMVAMYKYSRGPKKRKPIPELQQYKYLNDSILWYSGSVMNGYMNSNMLRQALTYLKSMFNLQFQVAYNSYEKFHDELKRLLNLHRVPSTGVKAIVAALTLCNRVNVYGFYPHPVDSDGNNIPFHYYGKYRNDSTQSLKTVHNWTEEFTVFQSWQSDGTLKFITTKCQD